MARKKTKWILGDVFAIPLFDGSWGIGHAVDFMMPNIVYCTLYSTRCFERPNSIPQLSKHSAISLATLTREQLDYGVWPVIGNIAPIFSKADFPNERFAANGYIGSITSDAALAEDFLSAFHAITPWDDWHDPNYLDTWLLRPALKPSVLKWKSSRSPA